MSDWLDIETAPRDIPILAWVPAEGVGGTMIVLWRYAHWDSWETYPYDDELDWYPTKWRLLPFPPIKEEADDE